MTKAVLFNTFAVEGMDLRDYFAAKMLQSIGRDIEDEVRAAKWC